MKSVGLNLDDTLSVPLDAAPPSPPPFSSSTFHPTIPEPDRSIPLHTRLAGKLEVFAGKVVRDEGMVWDGTVRGRGVEAGV
ncbi:hypothetical protein JCM8547_006397 [Rhodosporidiobolus lusitaniae]